MIYLKNLRCIITIYLYNVIYITNFLIKYPCESLIFHIFLLMRHHRQPTHILVLIYYYPRQQ